MSRKLLSLTLAALFLALLLVGAGLEKPRAAQAQFGAVIGPAVQPPVIQQTQSQASPPPQPLAIQSLDATHFVVVTREPRLVARGSDEGPVQNMVVTVVTHYTVEQGKLFPVEHVRVPTGFNEVLVNVSP